MSKARLQRVEAAARAAVVGVAVTVAVMVGAGATEQLQVFSALATALAALVASLHAALCNWAFNGALGIISAGLASASAASHANIDEMIRTVTPMLMTVCSYV